MYLYLGTFIGSYIISCINAAALAEKFKRDGYVMKKKLLFENISNFIRTTLIMAIPVYNIVFTFATFMMLDHSRYEEIKDEYIEKGVIYKKDDLADNIKVDVITKNNNNYHSKNSINYKDLSRDEKLTFLNSEREKLMNSNNETFQRKKIR